MHTIYTAFKGKSPNIGVTAGFLKFCSLYLKWCLIGESCGTHSDCVYCTSKGSSWIYIFSWHIIRDACENYLETYALKDLLCYLFEPTDEFHDSRQ